MTSILLKRPNGASWRILGYAWTPEAEFFEEFCCRRDALRFVHEKLKSCEYGMLELQEKHKGKLEIHRVWSREGGIVEDKLHVLERVPFECEGTVIWDS